MGAIIIILPVLAFDLWLMATTGKKQFQVWARERAWRKAAGLGLVGMALGVWLGFFVEYKWGATMRVTGFPIPDAFASLEDGRWTAFVPPAQPLRSCGIAVNFLSGLAAPLLPFKVAEFLRAVKAEL